MRIGLTLYMSRATRGGSRGLISCYFRFGGFRETRNENKRGEYVPVIYARGALQLTDLSVHPSASRYRHTGMDYAFVSAGASMLITIVCPTIRLKCTFINRIHRGYLSGCRTISP